MSDRQKAAKWAHDLLKTDFAILDTETTGRSSGAQIVQIGIIDNTGKTLLDSLISPTCEIEPEAIAIHGINDLAVQGAPFFYEMLIPILKSVGKRDVVIYNAEFDLKLIRQSLRPYGIQLAFPTSDRRQCRIFPNGGSIHCAMLQYSRYIGEWNDSKGDYQWQSLPGGDHSALGDCRATLGIIRQMAASYQPADPIPGGDNDNEPNDITQFVGPGGGR